MNNSMVRCSYTRDNGEYVYGGEGVNISYKFIVAELDEVTSGASYDSTYGNYGYAPHSLHSFVKEPVAEQRQFQGVWAANINNSGKLVNSKFIKLLDTPQ